MTLIVLDLFSKRLKIQSREMQVNINLSDK